MIEETNLILESLELLSQNFRVLDTVIDKLTDRISRLEEILLKGE